MNAMIRQARHLWLTFDQMDLPNNGRPTNATDVVALARSIEAIGLQVPLTGIERDGRYLLIAGRHRLEALRVLGHEKAPVRVVDFDDVEARLWTISENLHRTELSVTQRSELIAEYARLAKQRREAERGRVSAQLAPEPRAEDISAQLGPKPQAGRPESGDRLAARDLGVTRQEVQRAKAIAALPDEVKEIARKLGLEDNQSALMEATKASTCEGQIETMKRRAKQTTARPRSAPHLRNLQNMAAGELARWVKITTPNDRLHVIRVLEEAAAILRDELGRDASQPS